MELKIHKLKEKGVRKPTIFQLNIPKINILGFFVTKKLTRKLKKLINNLNYFSKFIAYVPIMTGCNNFCAFCVVPFTRGREISRPSRKIIWEVKNLIKRNFKEIWLLGQNVNSYYDPEEKINFSQLLKKINEIPGNFWIRFTSSHPKDFSKGIIDVIAMGEKITEYLNLPVQSGDNEILKKMNRPYTIEEYKDIIKEIRKKIPEICLSTDIIAVSYTHLTLPTN